MRRSWFSTLHLLAIHIWDDTNTLQRRNQPVELLQQPTRSIAECSAGKPPHCKATAYFCCTISRTCVNSLQTRLSTYRRVCVRLLDEDRTTTKCGGHLMSPTKFPADFDNARERVFAVGDQPNTVPSGRSPGELSMRALSQTTITQKANSILTWR